MPARWMTIPTLMGLLASVPAFASPCVPAWARSAAPPVPATSSVLAPERGSAFLSGDRLYAAAAVAGIALAFTLDRQVAEDAPESNGPRARGLSRAAERLGNPAVVGSALLASYAAGHLIGAPAWSSASARVAGAVLGAGAICEVAKLGTGRTRPSETPGDPDDLRPFGSGRSFPSGHTTIAFALASAIDQETGARWVPWLLYPAASLTGWSRLRDDRHWLSDVVGGAALGLWAGRRFDRWEQDARGPHAVPRLFLGARGRGVGLGIATRF